MELICNEKLLEHIRRNLATFRVRPAQGEGLARAAVALVVVDVERPPGIHGMEDREMRPGEAALVLTQRSLLLNHHAGQWALPGGRMEPGECPEETALRELAEEVDLELSMEQVIGRLDDFETRSSFAITPVVAWGGPGVTLKPNPAEVAAIHRIPLTEFMRKDAPLLDKIPESPNPVLRMPVGNTSIAAPTAALLYQFREVAILGKGTRVAHFEQPLFAWQ